METKDKKLEDLFGDVVEAEAIATRLSGWLRRSILRGLVSSCTYAKSDVIGETRKQYCVNCGEPVDDCASRDWCSFGPARRLLRELEGGKYEQLCLRTPDEENM